MKQIEPQPDKDKYDLCDGFEEIFAMAFADPECGEPGLRKLLSMSHGSREDLEDAALGLTDAGMRKAAKIVSEMASSHPSDDELDVCPWPENTTNAQSWYAAKPHRSASRKLWREEKRRRKRAGTW